MAEGGALLELEDQRWFPAYLRRMQTEYIGWLVKVMDVYRPLAPILADALNASGSRKCIDLGSGNGGPVRSLAATPELSAVQFMLTDLYPSPDVPGRANIAWIPDPLDALSDNIPEGFRTMFNVYHHFSEEEKQRLIGLHGRNGFLAAEILRPDPLCFLHVLIATTVFQILLCPFVAPFRWQRLFFTWIIPINLITVLWDGLVSVVRVDDQRKLEARFRQFAPAGTRVESGRCGPWWARVAWAMIIPERS